MMRPWYFSVTAILGESGSEGWEKFKTVAKRVLMQIPVHQIPVRPRSWHFTVFAMAKFQTETPPKTIEKYLVDLLGLIRNDIPDRLDFKLRVILKEFICYDSGTCPQFEARDDVLTRMRCDLRVSLRGALKRLQELSSEIYSTLDDMNAKNSGNKAFGSIARSIVQPEALVERWKMPVQNPIELEFKRIHFLVSDEFLTNPAAFRDAERRSIRLDDRPSKSNRIR